ncbi:hypothetical protein KIH87_17155 [Paraneptunicella aestuarii]|uniref:hypothetical protein n=1 Tax=Paraneptunicella aestuarii TaxID=2831148 RepID=UPI001E3E5282|nr:hypothetical protein [Paraneptunicella aestuarii]UAA38391.1 hypothetical protein KIH87_17155 [Paraneptunicella aestuarii]
MKIKKVLMTTLCATALLSATSAQAAWYKECRGHAGSAWQFIPSPDTNQSPQEMNIGNRWYTVDSNNSCSLTNPSACSNYSYALLQMSKASVEKNWGFVLQWHNQSPDCWALGEDKTIPQRVLLVTY